jgi:hypothetical protein
MTEDEPVFFAETSVNLYRTARRNIPQDTSFVISFYGKCPLQ